jgi:GMP synthase (glutamine-hydrolysing)
VHPLSTALTSPLCSSDAGAVIVSGGPQSVYDPESLTVDTAVWDMPCPVLGICYGMQLMCQNLGGKVEEATAGEYGRASLDVVKPDARLFAGVDAKSDAWMSHRDRVVALPEGCVGCLECCSWPLACLLNGGWLVAC